MAMLALLATEPVAAAGFRVASVHYRTSKDKKDKRPSVYCLVPIIRAPDTVADQYAAIINEVFDELQDAIVKDAADKDPAPIGISDEDIGIAALLRYWQERATSKRLNSESIFAWLDSSATFAMVAESAAKHPEEKAKALMSLVRDTFGKLAAPVPGISKQVAIKLLAYWQEADASNMVGKVCHAKLSTLAKTDEAALFDSL